MHNVEITEDTDEPHMYIIYWMPELASPLHLCKVSPCICQFCFNKCKAPFGICEDPIQELGLALLLLQLGLHDLFCPEVEVVSLELGGLHW